MKKLILKKNILLKNMVIITGTHASGKSMIAPVIASLKNVEPVRKIYYIDQINDLLYLKKIPLEIAIYLINQILDASYYDQLIGRNLNYRAEDETSIFTAHNTKELIRRAKIKRGPQVILKANKEKKLFLLDTHDGLWFPKVWQNLNIKNLNIVHIHRNPIHIVNSWINANYGEVDKSFLNQIPSFDYRYKITPFYALNFKKNYKDMKPVDRIIEMVIVCVKNEISNSHKFNKGLLSIHFDSFATQTDFCLKKICHFLKIKKTKNTRKIMIRENLPRIIKPEDYLEKKRKIKSIASKEAFNKLLEIEKKYEKFYNRSQQW